MSKPIVASRWVSQTPLYIQHFSPVKFNIYSFMSPLMPSLPPVIRGDKSRNASFYAALNISKPSSNKNVNIFCHF